MRLPLAKGCRIPSTADDVLTARCNAFFSEGLSFMGGCYVRMAELANMAKSTRTGMSCSSGGRDRS
jgi:hypothetical protein